MIAAMLPWPRFWQSPVLEAWFFPSMALSLWVFLALSAKRLRDLGHSGWWAVSLLLLGMLPFFGVGIVVVLGCIRSKDPPEPVERSQGASLTRDTFGCSS